MICRIVGGLVLSLVLLSGCASVSVRSTEKTPHQPAPPLPAKIYIKPFAVPAENLRVDRGGEALIRFQADLADRLAQQLQYRLTRHLMPAEVVSRDFVPPENSGWLIDGRFDRVAQGSRALRVILGFGTGGTKVEATSVIYDLAKRPPAPFLRVQTTGGSNAMPGAVANVNPLMLMPSLVGVAVGAAGGANTGLGFDVKRTAREIVAALSDYAAELEMIPRERAMQPKRLGAVPLRVIDPVRPVNNPSSQTPSP